MEHTKDPALFGTWKEASTDYSFLFFLNFRGGYSFQYSLETPTKKDPTGKYFFTNEGKNVLMNFYETTVQPDCYIMHLSEENNLGKRVLTLKDFNNKTAVDRVFNEQ